MTSFRYNLNILKNLFSKVAILNLNHFRNLVHYKNSNVFLYCRLEFNADSSQNILALRASNRLDTVAFNSSFDPNKHYTGDKTSERMTLFLVML